MIKNIERQLVEILEELNSKLSNSYYGIGQLIFEVKYENYKKMNEEGICIGWNDEDEIPTYTFFIYIGSFSEHKELVTEIEIKQELLDSKFYKIVLDKDYIKENIINSFKEKIEKLNDTIKYLNSDVVGKFSGVKNAKEYLEKLYG